MPGGLDIGTLSGRIELEDKLSNVIDLIDGKLGQIDKRFGGFGASIAQFTAGFLTAEAVLRAVSVAADFAKDALVSLTTEGAKAADISANFEQLNMQAGRLGATLLGELREGLHNTVTDLDLMKTVNQDLAAGMNLTDKEFRTLADGAFALAQATGGDVKTALDTMNDAMLTGRTRAIAMLTGKIDLTDAEERFARSLNTTVDRLTAEEKLQAARVAILNKVSEATKRLGQQTDGLDEIIAQAAVAWGNFVDELGKAVATSPVLMAAFTEVQQALTDAFGGDQSNLIRTITGLIESAAISAFSFAQVVSDAVGIAGRTWNSFLIILESVAQGWRAIEYAIGTAAQAVLKFLNIGTGGMFDESIAQSEKHLESLYNKMAEGENRIAGYKAAQDDWAVSTGHVNDKLEEIRQRMIEAQQAAKDQTDATEGLKSAQERVAAATRYATDASVQQAAAFRLTSAEIKAQDEAFRNLITSEDQIRVSLEQADERIVAAAQHLLALGNSADTVAKIFVGQLSKAQVEMIEGWVELAEVQGGVEKGLAGIGDRVIAEVQEFMRMGASLDTLQKAYGLTTNQINAIATALEASDAKWDQEAENLQTTSGLVRTLSGEYITLAEAQKRHQAGGSMAVTKANLAQNAKYWGIPEGFAVEWAKKGASFQEIIDIWNKGRPLQDWVAHGPRIPGFKEGGVGDFGEGTLAMLHGKEAIVPLEKYDMGGMTLNFYVNGTAEESARKIGNIIMGRLKNVRKFGAA